MSIIRIQSYDKNTLISLGIYLVVAALILILVLHSNHGNQNAYAHANPVLYSPTSNSVIEADGTLPDEVVIAYSERPEPKASYIRVTNSADERIDNNDYKISDTNARESSVSIDPSKFAPGIYTVSWLALSKDDGHITKGSYVFHIATTKETSDAVATSASSTATTNGTAATNAFEDSTIVDNINVTYGISPFYSGVNNNFTVTLSDSNGNPPTNIKTVFMIFNNEQAGLGPISAELMKTGEGQYSGSGGYLSQPGEWEIKITAQRTDAYDLNHSFTFNIENRP